jgi:EAL domain-containing protein (putative c-di-GMP-specific phosphodiesterase class I)
MKWLRGQSRIDDRQRENVVKRLPAVLRTGEIFMVFQPMIDLQRECIFAYEALVRSTSEHYRDPTSLFEAAIESQCCGMLGRVVREIATESCPDATLFLNIHPCELEEDWLVKPDDPVFAHNHPIYLEITEAAPIADLLMGKSMIAELRSKSISLAIDDLGVGYSNLKNIAELAPDVVKLDRGLVADLATEPRMRILVRALVQLCNDLGARVVAEGVESEDEALALQDTGAHFAQGYYYGRPSRHVQALASA